jgi:hypothetical protein
MATTCSVGHVHRVFVLRALPHARYRPAPPHQPNSTTSQPQRREPCLRRPSHVTKLTLMGLRAVGAVCADGDYPMAGNQDRSPTRRSGSERVAECRVRRYWLVSRPAALLTEPLHLGYGTSPGRVLLSVDGSGCAACEAAGRIVGMPDRWPVPRRLAGAPASVPRLASSN